MKWALYNLTTTTKSGGVETSVWCLGQALARRGHQVTVIGGQGERAWPPEARDLQVLTFPYTPREAFPNLGSRAKKLLERLSLARRALPALRSEGFQRWVAFKPYDLPFLLWARRQGGRVAYLSGGTEFFPGYAFLARRLDHFAANSAFNAGQIQKATGLVPAVNYLGVNREVFRPRAPEPELAARAGLAPGDEALVSAVRLVALKGIQHAIAALGLLARERPRLKLLVAGEGPYRGELEQKAAELGLADRVRLLGFLPQTRLAGFYALGRVALFPSLGEESLGLSAAEALACGVPVVASRLGGLPEAVGPGGLLVEPRDAAGLAAAVGELLDQPHRAEQMAAAGQARVAELFDWDATAARLEAGLAI
ncbi:MAG: glycosyltransferase family 4 protein [Deltaproteobacteria bacterium]|nr:glycosyltransferase family 4 protein [Deltaproteobacteria bacterium]